ncbi:hypothetical protein GCM10025867_08640 [Frondihabitans sucicola]|uniref:LPXTG cell wall anchor domain-containing protein n=1 Tax=Frondihabitans sucicola TaxID=1268041 RepID=A0ABN6XZ16_9MICO|nr:hypothetical protein [Frondihabitans sucicola]BDZ48623.1 hypothetical protein GCM10025867_08640 [Frondihabitans sucicola]
MMFYKAFGRDDRRRRPGDGRLDREAHRSPYGGAELQRQQPGDDDHADRGPVQHPHGELPKGLPGNLTGFTDAAGNTTTTGTLMTAALIILIAAVVGAVIGFIVVRRRKRL